ncbi:MAG: hypothetical protein JOZ96_09390 [Acidobacteria bacterium]|nr:hypothetical protein [Acidobacteriota bacterium]
MRSKAFKSVRPQAAAARLGLLALLLALAAPLLLHVASRARAQVRAKDFKAEPPAPVDAGERRPAPSTKPRPQAPAPTNPQTPSRTKPRAPVLNDKPAPVTAESIRPVSVTQVNFRQLAQLAKRAQALRKTATNGRAAPIPGTIEDTPNAQATPPAANLQTTEPPAPFAASPAPSQTFLAQEDAPKAGTTNDFFIPPDTNGAVGLDRVFTNTNSNFRVHDKTTGAALATLSSDTFWAASGGSGFFDPQIQFDPYNQRWVLAIASSAGSANSSIGVAVSQTSDPAGTYNLFRFVVGCAGGTANCDPQGEWADFPMLGFNKNWLAVSVNMFEVAATGPNGAPRNTGFGALLVNYPSARAGVGVATLFRGFGNSFFCVHPVTTFSATENTLYFIQHGSSGGATYRVSNVTGTPAAPSMNIPDTFRVRPGGAWSQPVGDMLPQQCVAGVSLPTQTCPAAPRKFDAGDAQVRSNPVFRGGKLYYAQTVALPAGAPLGTDAFGHTVSLASRTAAQWTVLDAASGDFADGGRVDDPTATPANGGKWYAYPSLSVNKNGDVLLGFSEFESDDYADAGYALRLSTDAAGTMRDPVIYKEGEDYYEKTFGTPHNRWGDYSHTLVDPSNDRDLWTVQEYAGARVGTAGTGPTDSRWGTWWAKVTAPAAAGDLLISEFRLRGPAGAGDEFVEVYNNNDSTLTVATADGSAGYSIAASDGVVRCTIPSGTSIPARGHYLCINSSGYSLGAAAAGDASYTNDIADNTGVALFNTSSSSSFSAATRLDAAGFTSEANALYREGAGLTPLNPALNLQHSFYRDNCGKGGSATTPGACPSGGLPVDTNDNAADFVFVDTAGSDAGAGRRLGAPGPENLSSLVGRNGQLGAGSLDPSAGSSSPPNLVRDFAVDAPNNSPFGTLLIRRTITNNTGAPVTRLRFRVIDQTAFPVPQGYADLRARTSSATPNLPTVVNISGTNAACPSKSCTVQQTTLETPPAQPNGGAFNSTLAVGSVTLANPIPPGGQVNVQFLLGIRQTGTFKFFINVEALP